MTQDQGENVGFRRLPAQSVLDDHNRKKKKLIPPMLEIGNTQLVSTIDSIIPEVIWVGLLLDWHGLSKGIEVVSEFLGSLWNADEKRNWYRFSEHCLHSDRVADIISEEMRSYVQIAFFTFRRVYRCSGLQWAEGFETKEASTRRIIRTVEKYSNRFEQPYLSAIATIIYSMGLAGKMQFAPGTLPDIEALVSDWGTDRAKLAASSVRACSMAFFPHDRSSHSDEWCKEFWRRNYKIGECR